MSAHTPGPWEVQGRELVAHTGTGYVTIAALDPVNTPRVPHRDIAEANARLIAAAPDLYAALRDATDALDYVHAIDSVTPPECDPDDGLCGAQFCAQNGCLVRKIAVARTALAKATGVQS